MKLSLKNISTYDGDLLDGYTPPDALDFYLAIRMIIGAEGNGGSEYVAYLCTPLWLDRCIRQEGAISGRHHLIVHKYDRSSIVEKLKAIIKESERENLIESELVLTRHFFWEFEDYVA